MKKYLVLKTEDIHPQDDTGTGSDSLREATALYLSKRGVGFQIVKIIDIGDIEIKEK